MFRRLTGSEPGLVGLWNLEQASNGVVKDLSPGRRDGTLVGNARVVTARLPGAPSAARPAAIFGNVRNEQGNVVTNALINLQRQGQVLCRATCDEHGNYSMALLTDGDTFDFQVTSGDLSNWRRGVLCPPGRRTQLDFTLVEAVSIAGRVTAFDGSLLPNVVVQVVRADAAARTPGELAVPGLVATTKTSGTGVSGGKSYRFSNLVPGDYKVRIHLTDGQLEYHGGEIVHVAPGKPVTCDFQAGPQRQGRWRHYSTANGLPSSRIYDLYFAQNGMLWLATQSGVSKFDGARFTNFSKREGLLDNRVFCIMGDTGGRLWFGTEVGACRFDPISGRFESFPSGTNGLTGGRVFDILRAPDGVVWLRTREGLSRYDGQSFHAVSGIPRITLSSYFTKTRALAIDKRGRVWTVTMDADLWRVEGTNVVHLTGSDGLASANQDALYVAPDGAVWFQDEDNGSGFRGITRYDGQRFESISDRDMGNDSFVTTMDRTPAGVMWFGHFDGGATRYDARTGSFMHFTPESGAPGEWVVKVRSGPDGAVWFGTEGGLYRYEEGTFINFTKADGLPEGPVNVGAVASNGDLWFSSYGGDSPFLVRVAAGRTNFFGNPFANAAKEGLAPSIRVLGLAPDENGGLWTGGVPAGQGLYYCPAGSGPESERHFQHLPGPSRLRVAMIPALLIDTHGALWMGELQHGLYKANVMELWKSNAVSEQISSVTNPVGTIYEDSHGAIWTAGRFTSVGAPVSRISGQSVEYFTPGKELPAEPIRCFQEGPDGSLYAGTAAGVCRLDGKEFSSVVGTADRPVPAGEVWCILRDAAGVLWFASDSGLYRFDGISWSLLDQEDGLGGSDINSITQDRT
ncbi:MAG: two-component regulator propeller domain-containing protein, partial [Limisphaerales bacterium]